MLRFTLRKGSKDLYELLKTEKGLRAAIANTLGRHEAANKLKMKFVGAEPGDYFGVYATAMPLFQKKEESIFLSVTGN
jgi:hypothetical protein